MLDRLNKRESNAFAEVYTLLYRELTIYAYTISKSYNNIDPHDIVQDSFIRFWETGKQFNSIKGVKAYLYVAIRNTFLDVLDKSNVANKYVDNKLNNDNDTIDVIESEFYSIVDYSLGLLPEKFAEIIKLYLEGYSPAEIAKILNKPIQTIYNSKTEAIKILQKKISKDKLLEFNILINILTSF